MCWARFNDFQLMALSDADMTAILAEVSLARVILAEVIPNWPCRQRVARVPF